MCATVTWSSVNSAVTSVVPMPAYCGWFCADWMMEALARVHCSRSTRTARSTGEVSLRDGSESASALRTSSRISATAMPLATSPALYPPMPSASTASPISVSMARLSSLWERTMPGSVLLAIFSALVRSIIGRDARERAGCGWERG